MSTGVVLKKPEMQSSSKVRPKRNPGNKKGRMTDVQFTWGGCDSSHFSPADLFSVETET